MAKTSIYLGDVMIDRVVEDEWPFEHVSTLFPSLTEDQLLESRPWMQPAAMTADDTVVFSVNSYLIRTPRHTVLVDTCIGNDKPRNGRPKLDHRGDNTWMGNLSRVGLTVADVDVVMCTHLHADHIGWNTRLKDGAWVPTFPKASYLFAETDLASMEAECADSAVGSYADSILPIIEAGQHRPVPSDFELDDFVRLLPTPGHTVGHFAVVVGKKRDLAVMSGDLIHSPIQARYPELHMRADADPESASRTRRAFLERYCDTDTVCCTTHFPAPSFMRVTRWEDGFRCVPVE